MLYRYSVKTYHQLYLKKTVMFYFFSLFNFFLNCFSIFFLFKLFFSKTRKLAYFFFLFNFFSHKEKYVHIYYLLFKKLLCIPGFYLYNKDTIYFFLSSNKKKTNMISLLRSFFIYKKSFEQFGKQVWNYTFGLNSFFFNHLYIYNPSLESVIISKEKTGHKLLNFYIK